MTVLLIGCSFSSVLKAKTPRNRSADWVMTEQLYSNPMANVMTSTGPLIGGSKGTSQVTVNCCPRVSLTLPVTALPVAVSMNRAFAPNNLFGI